MVNLFDPFDPYMTKLHDHVGGVAFWKFWKYEREILTFDPLGGVVRQGHH